MSVWAGGGREGGIGNVGDGCSNMEGMHFGLRQEHTWCWAPSAQDLFVLLIVMFPLTPYTQRTMGGRPQPEPHEIPIHKTRKALCLFQDDAMGSPTDGGRRHRAKERWPLLVLSYNLPLCKIPDR